MNDIAPERNIEVRKIGYRPDMVAEPGVDAAFSRDLMDRVYTEAAIANFRLDANKAGTSCFEKLDLPTRDNGRDNLYEKVAQGRQVEGVYDFLDGKESEQRSDVLAQRIIPGNAPEAVESRETKRGIFEYIVDFWDRSTIGLDIGQDTGGGLNLALRPFATPTGVLIDSEFQFNEQYRWDTTFQNMGLIIAGGSNLALGQLKNKIDVFALSGLIPNALTTSFLTHGQPPLEVIEAKEIAEKVGPGDWYGTVMKTIEQDLWDNWLDAGSGTKNPRQNFMNPDRLVMADNYLLTRHTNIHFNEGLVGCEDGKDHYEIPVLFGESYLPVQLNAILQGHFEALQEYYGNFRTYHPDASGEELNNAAKKEHQYQKLATEHKEQFQRVFWEDEAGWEGFRNYALKGNKHDGEEGRIKFDDLSAEVFPLAFGLATTEQATIIKDNIINNYLGDLGLASTAPLSRPGSIEHGLDPAKLQWSTPNCWPPLVEMAVRGLEKYGFNEEASEIMDRWVKAQEQAFKESGFFHEKTPYDSSQKNINAGLYGQIQGGFGWTIGVYLKFLHKQATAKK